MAISSASTFAEIEAEYLDTASFLQKNDLALAHRHAIAIRFLLLKVPTNTVKGGNSVSYSMSLLTNELHQVQEWIKAKELAVGGGSRFIRVSMRQGRARG